MNKRRKQEGEYKMAQVLLINGSSNEEGCTYTALCEVAGALKKEGIEAEIIQLGKEDPGLYWLRQLRKAGSLCV